MVRRTLLVVVAVAASVVVGTSFAAEKTGPKGDRGTPPSPPAGAPAPAKATANGEATTSRYGDWALTCRPLTPSSTSPAKAPATAPGNRAAPVPATIVACEGTQLLRKSEDGSDLAHYRLTRTDDAGLLRVSILVPANARMDTPLRLVRGGDTKDAMVLRWMVCTLGGCRAEADVRASDLKSFASGAPGGIATVYLDATTRPVTLPLVTNGLAELISALAPEPKGK